MKDPDYIHRIHNLPCCVCVAFGFEQTSRTEAHHTICGRYSQRKTPDRQAIPLCDGHHQAKYDKTKLAIHNGKKSWVDVFGLDTDYIAATQDELL